MANSASATITAKTGAGQQDTSYSLTGITSYRVDVARSVIQFFTNGENQTPTKEFDLIGVTTFTITTPGGNQVIVIS